MLETQLDKEIRERRAKVIRNNRTYWDESKPVGQQEWTTIGDPQLGSALADVAEAAIRYRSAKESMDRARQIPWEGGEVGCLPPTFSPNMDMSEARKNIKKKGEILREVRAQRARQG